MGSTHILFHEKFALGTYGKYLYLYICIAESTVYAYTDRPYLVIPVYMPCSRGPDKVKPVNGHSNTPYLHLWDYQNNKETFPCVWSALRRKLCNSARFLRITPRDWAQSSHGQGYMYSIQGAGWDNFFQNFEMSKGSMMNVNLHSKKSSRKFTIWRGR